MSCGLGHRHGSDVALLWLWHRPAATAPIWPLAWECPYAMGITPKINDDDDNNNNNNNNTLVKEKSQGKLETVQSE